MSERPSNRARPLLRTGANSYEELPRDNFARDGWEAIAEAICLRASTNRVSLTGIYRGITPGTTITYYNPRFKEQQGGILTCEEIVPQPQGGYEYCATFRRGNSCNLLIQGAVTPRFEFSYKPLLDKKSNKPSRTSQENVRDSSRSSEKSRGIENRASSTDVAGLEEKARSAGWLK